MPRSSRNRLAQALVLFLVERGADLSIKDGKGKTALDYIEDEATRKFIEK